MNFSDRGRIKSTSSPLRPIFDFEFRVVEFSGGNFLALADAAERWTFGWSECSGGEGFRIFYELKDGRYLMVLYGPCKEGSYLNVGIQEIPVRHSSIYPVVEQVTLERVLRQFARAKAPIPFRLTTRHAESEAKQRPRDLRNWIGKGHADITCRLGLPGEAQVVELAGTIHVSAIQLVQILRDWDSARQGMELIDGMFQRQLFAAYPLDPRDWWGPKTEIPPARVRFVDLRWPFGADSILQSLLKLYEILEPAAAIGRMLDKYDHPDHPTRAEHAAAVTYLLNARPRLEKATIELKLALEAFAARPPVPAPDARPKMKPPSEDAVRIYYFSMMSGDKQSEIARKYTEQTGIPMDQGTVSRHLATVRAWKDSGNPIPEIREPPPRPETPMDPKAIDLGANREQRTPRQRRKRDQD